MMTNLKYIINLTICLIELCTQFFDVERLIGCITELSWMLMTAITLLHQTE